MTRLKKNSIVTLKCQIVNSFMRNGKKRTGEKILLKLSKTLQKSTSKNFQSLVHSAVINLASAFKLNEQTMKKGKRKSKKVIPSFITKDSLRIMTALKSIRQAAQKDRSSSSFYESLRREILDTSSNNGKSLEQKIKLQNQVLLNRRYLAKFKW